MCLRFVFLLITRLAVAAVEVADAMGAAVGRGQAGRLLLPRPGGTVGGADGQGPELVERIAADGTPTGQRRDRRADRAPCHREQRLGVPADPRRAAQARPSGRRVHDPPGPPGAADPAGSGSRTSAALAIMAPARRRRCQRTSRQRLPRLQSAPPFPPHAAAGQPRAPAPPGAPGHGLFQHARCRHVHDLLTLSSLLLGRADPCTVPRRPVRT